MRLQNMGGAVADLHPECVRNCTGEETGIVIIPLFPLIRINTYEKNLKKETQAVPLPPSTSRLIKFRFVTLRYSPIYQL